jgi:hypothetical protein
LRSLERQDGSEQRHSRLPAAVFLMACAGQLLAQSPPSPGASSQSAPAPASGSMRFEKNVAAYEAADKASPPLAGAMSGSCDRGWGLPISGPTDDSAIHK